MRLFAERLSTGQMQINQLRLHLSVLAYKLMEALPWLASLAPMRRDSSTTKRLTDQDGSVVRVSVCRILLQFATTLNHLNLMCEWPKNVSAISTSGGRT